MPSRSKQVEGADKSADKSIGLVLSGGGMRGAYEVGVLSGIVEVLSRGPARRSPFQVLAGSSVGAINAAFIAANADRPDLAISELERTWRSLDLEDYLRMRPLRFTRAGDPRAGRGLIDPKPLEKLIRSAIPFHRIRANVASGLVHALFVAALHTATGKTVLFSELASSTRYVPSRDRRREAVRTAIEAEHVLASTALPLLFPARRIGQRYYCDGGLRFNTPIAPVIRAGADRLVVIAPFEPFQTIAAPGRVTRPPMPSEEVYPTPLFLLGKLLDVLILDPVLYDLQLLERQNDLVRALEEELSASALAQVNRVMTAARGFPYRRIDTLVFAPSEDLGALAAEHLRHLPQKSRLGLSASAALRYAAERSEAEWASYVLFDGKFASRLIELGRRDALKRSAEIKEFFAFTTARRRSSQAPRKLR